MRQLLHCSGPHSIVALHNETFAVVSEGNDDNAAVAVELLPPTECSIDDRQGDCVENEDDSKSGALVGAKIPVQAVASMLSPDGSNLLCAVSRSDKSLSLYCISIGAELKHSSLPFAVYKLPKRACCLDLTRIPASDDEKSSIDVVVAGDLAGDVTAYQASKATNEAGENAGTSRLLLGHTATMITGVKVTADSGTMRVLSSDRDEKVRISSFPQTCVLEGFLLGHTAFIVSLDVALKDGCTRCVTCGGDGTVRLWDYALCKELATLKAVSTTLEKGEETKQESNSAACSDMTDGSSNDKDSAVETTPPRVLVPTVAAISYDGSMVAVVRDGFDSVDIYAISGSDSNISLCQKQSVKCSSLPLSVTFLLSGDLCILTKDPTFILQYAPAEGSKELCCVTEKSSLCAALKSAAARKQIVMPSSLLETDQSGQLKLSKDKDKSGVKHEPW
eukprot:CAMPEP_0113546988 /NCGR_PEP_ID=MMETSP0015_2-20120614/12107_1 /TAXON_ID=2838 /ORGANISM="Odontella" /LENGTH=447 /DNA_ID=CAMNT_0000447495 /DNA_START=26 /DNA_END=1366 /DNA_ORIENTATION=+ /assembly_acc=CAM_ASM_000160